MSAARQSAALPTTPFFIVGNPRSGTTLLRTMLCGHGNIYIPAETGFLPHLAHSRYAGRGLNRPEVQQLVELVGRMNREWAGLVECVDRFYESLNPATLTTVVDALYRLQIKPHGARRWGDKGPSYVRVIPQLDQVFPTAQYIHIIRDGRDSSLSALKKWGSRYWYYDSYYLLRNWKRNVEQGMQCARWLGPSRYLEIRYESFVADTERTIRTICDFLGEPFESGMLEHVSMGREIAAPTGHHEVQQAVHTRTVENWKRNMSAFDQKLANRVAGGLLAELGYERPELPAMSVAEQVRYIGLASQFSVTDTMRRFLYAVGWLTMSREKATRTRATTQPAKV